MYTLYLHTIEEGKEFLICSFNSDKAEDYRIPQKGESILYQDNIYKVIGVCTCLDDTENTSFSLMLEKNEDKEWWK